MAPCDPQWFCVIPGGALPGRMPSQQGEDDGRAGDDAELAKHHAEVSHSCHAATKHKGT